MKQVLNALSWTAWGRASLPFLIMGISLWVLGGVLDAGVVATLPASIRSLPVPLLVLATAFCAVSLWAVAAYDGLAHRHFQTGTNSKLARTSGFAAIAIAQTVGFGIVTGAAVRWRMVPALGLAGAMRMSVFVSLTFLTALGVLTALACLILPAPDWTTLPALVFLVVLPLAFLILSFAPVCTVMRNRAPLPSLRAVCAILGWTTLDVMAAALALFVLIPTPELHLASFLPVFLLALGAAMLSGAPGGVGPFELTLIGLLPQVPAADLITGIVVFRTLYYAVPALLAVALAFTARKPAQQPVSTNDPTPDFPLTAELGILAQNNGHVHTHEAGNFALWNTRQTSVLLFDPVTGGAVPALTELKAQAHSRVRTACLYKCGARQALAARMRGWAVMRIAQDCIVDLSAYNVSQPAFSGLRRKLRKAEKAGITVHRPQYLPLDEMTAIDAAWQAAHGRARGGTMGRFCPDYLATQDVYLAYRADVLVGYVSLHRHANRPCLDLVRHLPDLPDGTMHLLIHSAIMAAQAEGATHLSLAALPYFPDWIGRFGRLSRPFHNPGLRQFKSSFGPGLLPRYAAAPTPLGLAIALADIASEVHHPPPLAKRLPISGPVRHTRGVHKQDEEYDIALPA
ncbi:DUF2156 domain containing protein [Sulfitobacter noctilucae]|uniref:phosphatidylglycerol lysyltransferase domain-containing protein n=1 Tax=Sulfitobacter noctilucae TaxID=1342302 RepID=UPI00046AAB51|nr:phosphatidylglycerol lysyltransferase domain-containing protein [Sulfitobacter noctilucae]KIN61202.1 DUF2156 domain containing protein [Sulfitobacter noctilucae]